MLKASRLSWLSALVLAALIVGCQDAASQSDGGSVHPAKQAYADVESWPATSPGDVALKNFVPFRAVYERSYRNENGDPRIDRVIVTAEHVAWAAEGAIMVGLVDTGSLDYTDTTARSQIRYFAADDLSLRLQVMPAPGTAKDYGVLRAEDGAMHMTMVETATGETQHQERPATAPGFGAPGAWLFASMPLSEGAQIRFDPYYAPASSSILGADASRVIARETVQGPGGESFDAWVLERPLGMSSPRLMRTHVVDRPPYLVGKTPFDADIGEAAEIGSLRLIEFQTFPG